MEPSFLPATRESGSHRLLWDGRDIKSRPVPTPAPPAVPGCSRSRPTRPWALPGMGELQLLWEFYPREGFFSPKKWVLFCANCTQRRKQGKSAERQNDCSQKIHAGGETSLLNPSNATAWRVTLNGTLHLVLPPHLLCNFSKSGKQSVPIAKYQEGRKNRHLKELLAF